MGYNNAIYLSRQFYFKCGINIVYLNIQIFRGNYKTLFF